MLSRKEFSFDPSVVNYLLSFILRKGIEVDPKPTGIQLIDMKDLVFYEVVLEKKRRWRVFDHGEQETFSQ